MKINLLWISEEDENGVSGDTQELAPPEMDVEKVIEYPGFTTEVPPGYIEVSFLKLGECWMKLSISSIAIYSVVHITWDGSIPMSPLKTWPALAFGCALFSCQFTCAIPLITADSMVWLKTVWILIRWLHQKLADLDLQCIQNRIYQCLEGKEFSKRYWHSVLIRSN